MRTALLLALMTGALVTTSFLTAGAAFGQGSAPAPTAIAQAFDAQVNNAERDVLGLAKKMPAEAYSFAPSAPGGAFEGVYTFGQQVRHVATLLYTYSARALGEQPPANLDKSGAPPAAPKEDTVAYLEGALAYAHKAARSLTAETPQAQIAAATSIVSHTNDHYGQMVIYARMKGVTPGAAAPAQGKGK